MTDQPTWETNRIRINGLWSRYNPTPEEREFIVRRLSALNQRWLDAAIDSYRAASASTVFHCAELLEHYRRIANTGAERATARRTDHDAIRSQWAAELERDRTEAIRALRKLDRSRIREAVDALRAAGWIGREPLPGKFEDWRDSALFGVYNRLV